MNTNPLILSRLVPRSKRAAGAVAVVLVLLAAALASVRLADDRVRVVAEFASAVGVYEGSEVRLMGVPIGTVAAIETEDTAVRLTLEYDADYDLPADARAVIVSPSVIADRFVQFTPSYDGSGPLLGEGDVIPQQRTRVPVELDQVFATTNDLLVALGPRGANQDGSFNRLLKVGAANLEGQGPAVRRMLKEVAAASETLASTSPDLFATVRGLSHLTRALAANDRDVRRFNTQMSDVTAFLARDRQELSAVLQSLAGSLGQVETFVRTNRRLLVRNVDKLGTIAATLQAERDALDSLLGTIPVALNNLNRVWDPDNQSIRSRANLDQIIKDLDGAICDAIIESGAPLTADTCAQLIGALGDVG